MPNHDDHFMFIGRLSSKMRQSGEILINGRKKTLAYGTSVSVILTN